MCIRYIYIHVHTCTCTYMYIHVRVLIVHTCTHYAGSWCAVWAAGHYRTHECVPNRDTRVQHGTIWIKAENYYFWSVGSVSWTTFQPRKESICVFAADLANLKLWCRNLLNAGVSSGKPLLLVCLRGMKRKSTRKLALTRVRARCLWWIRKQKIRDKSVRFRWSVGTDHPEKKNWPESWFLCRYKSSNFKRFPRDSGMAPA